jgi:hypothetical protein
VQIESLHQLDFRPEDLAYMTSKALRRLHIPTATIKSRGKSRFPAANERAPEPNTIRWKGVRDLFVSLHCKVGRQTYMPLDSAVGSSHILAVLSLMCNVLEIERSFVDIR